MMLALRKSNFPPIAPRGRFVARKEPPVPFLRAFLLAVRTALSSMSTPRTFRAPFFAINMPRIPVPHPMSRHRSGTLLSNSFSMSSMQSRVVSCDPVPKACPGSMTITVSPAGASYVSQEGVTVTALPTFRGRKNSFHLSAQPKSSTSTESTA